MTTALLLVIWVFMLTLLGLQSVDLLIDWMRHDLIDLIKRHRHVDIPPEAIKTMLVVSSFQPEARP